MTEGWYRVAGRTRNVRLVRLRAGLGLTQAELAERLTDEVRRAGPEWRHATLPGEYVCRLETGRITWPNATYRAALRMVLGVESDAELGLYCRQAGARFGGDHVLRRQFLAAVPAVALTGTALTGTGLGGSLGEIVDAAAGPVSAPRRVGVEQVQQVRDLVVQARELDGGYGGGMAADIIRAHVRWAVGLFDAHVDRDAEAPLAAATSDLCIAAAWAAFDAGLDGLASQYHLAALHCAESAGDWALRARSLDQMAVVAAYRGDGDEALTLVHQSQVRADRLTSLRQADLATTEAQVHGRLGDEAACLRAVGRSENLFAASDPTQSPQFVGLACAAALNWRAGRGLYWLADRGRAVGAATQRLTSAVTDFPAHYNRARAVAATTLADLTMRHGDRDEAVQLGNQALDLAAGLHSNRITDSIRGMHRAAARYAGTPEVDAFRRRATRMLAS